MKRLAAARYKDVKPVTMHEPALPHRLVVLIHRLMEIDPEKRIQTAQIAMQEAESALEAIKKGDLKKYDENLSETEAANYQSAASAKEEGVGKTLLLIESNVKVQDSLRERLKAIGYRVLITGNPKTGLSRFEDLDPAEDVPADCVIIGCAGLAQSGIEAFEDFVLGEYTSKMPGILVTVEKVDRLVKKEWFDPDHRVKMEMPVKFKKVQKALRKLLGIEVAQSPPASPKNVEPAKPVQDGGAIDDTDVDLA